MSVSAYILEFDKRYLKTKNLGTQMSDDLLAYRLLRNANLGDQYTKLIKATAKLEYESMKQQLKNLFSDIINNKRHSICFIYVILRTYYIHIFPYFYIMFVYISW